MGQTNLSENAIRVLQARYLRRDENGSITETPDDLFRRVARAITQAEVVYGDGGKSAHWEEEFFQLLSSLDFLPNSPTLMNAGTSLGQLSGCFVLPVDDTMEGIFESLKQMALIQRAGGGTGFSFSRLRPKGDTVASTGGEASGPVSFMKIFDAATSHIKQGGKRRGANMGILRVEHPDILEFIDAKRDSKDLQNFNISVAVTDSFLNAAREKRPYDLVHPRTGAAAGRLQASEVFDKIVEAAWASGDPGLLFVDAVQRANPTRHLGTLEATNPCGEIPLLPYESCNLGSVNLANMVRKQGPRATVDWELLRATVRNGVRFLDNVIEVNQYPVEEISRISRGTRKIGLGVMGFAEMLLRLGISYDSEAAVELAEDLMRTVGEEAFLSSQRLAEDRGVFPEWKGSIYEASGTRMRNATRTAIAPTGTIGIIAGTTPGIEPLFALAYRRRHVLGDETLCELNPLFHEYLETHAADPCEVLRQVQATGSLQGVNGIPDDVKRLFVTALEIPVERHLQVQAAFQRHVDNSVSKTVNLPTDATPENVAHAYWRAWELGLKGITVYRYGSKSKHVLKLGVHAT